MESFQYKYKARVIKVVDGDTIDLMIDKGFSDFSKKRVRLYDIDTPEIHGVKKDSEEFKAGMVAKDFVRAKLSPLTPTDYVVVETIKDKIGKYGRYLAKIWYLEDAARKEWKCINDELLEKGLATEY